MTQLPKYSREDLRQVSRFLTLISEVMRLHVPTAGPDGKQVCEHCQTIPRRKGPATWPCRDHVIVAEWLRDTGYKPGVKLF